MLLSPTPIQKFFANNGEPLAGGLLFTYAAGTSDKVATYKNQAGSEENTNPIVLDFRGECRLWLDPDVTYKFVLSPPGDTDPPTNPIWTVDEIAAGSGSDGAAGNYQFAAAGPGSPVSIPEEGGLAIVFDAEVPDAFDSASLAIIHVRAAGTITASGENTLVGLWDEGEIQLASVIFTSLTGTDMPFTLDGTVFKSGDVVSGQVQVTLNTIDTTYVTRIQLNLNPSVELPLESIKLGIFGLEGNDASITLFYASAVLEGPVQE